MTVSAKGCSTRLGLALVQAIPHLSVKHLLRPWLPLETLPRLHPKPCPHRSMDRLAALNAAGVAASILLAVVSTALAVLAAVSGQAHPVSMLPQWELLGPTWGQQIEALTDVIPVVLACYVAHQSLHPLMPLLKPYSQQRMIKVGVGVEGKGGLRLRCLCHAQRWLWLTLF